MKTQDQLWAEYWEKIGLPTIYQQAKLSDFNEDFELNLHKSILIKGPNGTGKTHLAAALLRKARDVNATMRFISAAMYLKRIRSSFRKYSRESEMDIFDEFRKPHVLVLDDLGAEKQGEFGITQILELLENRMSWGGTTIVTSNLQLPDIHTLEPRLASRMASFQQVRLEGKDMRIALRDAPFQAQDRREL